MRGNPTSRARFACAAAVLFLIAILATGCAGRDGVRTTTAGAVAATGTVQAGEGAASDLGTTPSNGKPWPRKVALFAADANTPVWYPTYLPAGYEVESVDVVEFDQGAGLVCDVLFLNGDKAVTFVQGSPTNRRYDIESSQATGWGDSEAQVVNVDPADPTSASLIVIEAQGNFAELGGDASLDELKKIAASMEVVE